MMENRMETTVVCCGYLGIMEEKMEATIISCYVIPLWFSYNQNSVFPKALFQPIRLLRDT